jgi:thiamine biosynthesis protein ThiS
MSETFSITLNGEPHAVSVGTTVDALVRSLGMKVRRVAVEINREIVARAKYESVRIAPGDEVEIVNFVGGG